MAVTNFLPSMQATTPSLFLVSANEGFHIVQKLCKSNSTFSRMTVAQNSFFIQCLTGCVHDMNKTKDVSNWCNCQSPLRVRLVKTRTIDFHN